MLGYRNNGTDAGTRREDAQTSREIARMECTTTTGGKMRGSDRLRRHPELPETQTLAGGENTALHGPLVKSDR
jgi:hypothetical protein